MKTKILMALLVATIAISGCNVSPLSPLNKPRINNNGDIGEIKNNQNGIMAEIMTLKNRLDVVAKEVENIQNGFINSSNKNFGVQIFQGEGGLAIGLALVVIISLVAANYKLKLEKYKKTAEILGEKIKKLNNIDIENDIFTAALANKVESQVYRILKS